MKTPSPIVIGADHAGYALKEFVKTYLAALNFDVNDCGPGGEDSVDYTDFGCMVAEGISSGRFERGVLICGTGQGMAMTANRFCGAWLETPFEGGRHQRRIEKIDTLSAK